MSYCVSICRSRRRWCRRRQQCRCYYLPFSVRESEIEHNFIWMGVAIWPVHLSFIHQRNLMIQIEQKHISHPYQKQTNDVPSSKNARQFVACAIFSAHTILLLKTTTRIIYFANFSSFFSLLSRFAWSNILFISFEIVRLASVSVSMLCVCACPCEHAFVYHIYHPLCCVSWAKPTAIQKYKIRIFYSLLFFLQRIAHCAVHTLAIQMSFDKFLIFFFFICSICFLAG